MQKEFSRTSSCALLIFTRNPVLGQCKTRLAATIGDHAALEIYRLLLKHTASVTEKLEEVDKFVYFSEEPVDGSYWDPSQYRYQLQKGNDLGVRMRLAFEKVFHMGYSRVVIIGSDLYDLSTQDLKQAFEELGRHEVVLGPAKDGGYYLLGLIKLLPGLFSDKEWGSGSVLQRTLADLEGMKIHLLQVRNDVDRYEDIAGNPIFESIIKQAGNE